MIPSELLFQMSPIITIFSFHLLDVVLIGGVSFLLAVIFFIIVRWYRSIKIKQTLHSDSLMLSFPEVDDADFEMKIAQILRQRIGYPRGSPEAHTANELLFAGSRHPFLRVLTDIEKKEYQGETLGREDRILLLERIQGNT